MHAICVVRGYTQCILRENAIKIDYEYRPVSCHEVGTEFFLAPGKIWYQFHNAKQIDIHSRYLHLRMS